MADSLHRVTSDITDEPYKGPNAVATAAGEASIAHFALGFFGLIGGFIATYVFHKPVGNFIARQQVKGLKLVQSAEKGEKRWGKILLSLFGHPDKHAFTSLLKPVESATQEGGHLLHEIATEELTRSGRGWLYNASDEIRKIPGVKQLLGLLGDSEEAIKRIDTSIIGGGILGAFGFFIAPMVFWITGAKHAGEGKDQFERAKDEIHTLRQQYDSLREKYVETTTKLEEAKAGGGMVITNSKPKRRDDTKPQTTVSAVARESVIAPQHEQAISS